MGAKRALIAVTIGLIIGWFFKTPKNESKSEGTVQNKFQSVRKNFDEILCEEKEGLALAAYKGDELVVDLWGGYAERAALRKWNRDTMTVVFSSTKAVGALIIAILVSRGHLRYEDKIVQYWPEFGAHQKENITVQWIIDHKAGLIVFDGELSMEQSQDHRYVSRLIENTKSKWPAGTAVGYHALTFGWLLDQLVRRVDPAKRGIAQFFREEIHTHMKDKDFFLGLPRNEHYRVARIVQPTMFEFIRAMITSTKYHSIIWKIFMNGGHCEFCPSATYPQWLSVLSREMPYNNPAVREIENIAALGIATARGLADVVSTVWKENLISEEVWKRLSEPVEYVKDMVTEMHSYRGHGFFYEPHPTRQNAYIMLHSGHGVQNLIIDPHNKVVVAIIRNGLLWDISTLEETVNLAKNIFRIAVTNS